MDLKKYVFDKAIEARAGARALAKASSKQKNEALVRMAEALKKRAKELIFGKQEGYSIRQRQRAFEGDDRPSDAE